MQPTSGRLRFVRTGLWRWNAGDAELALKLFDGVSAHERLRTEAALYQDLCRVRAPVPGFVAADADALALARVWIPGTTLYEQLAADEPPGQSQAWAVRDAWLRLLNSLAPWNARIASTRREAARRKRGRELSAVAQALMDAMPRLPTDAIHALCQTVTVRDPVLLPLDASPSNVVIDGKRVTFIDLELLGLDFADWTYAKYVSAANETGTLRSLAAVHPDDSGLPGLDASVALLSLARVAGLWNGPRIATESLANVLSGSSWAIRRIRQSLGLESSVTSDSG
ncbi:MAG: phosphotransferase [Chloroflexi bacterium]|nr:phosphotransferase [Chloroflexota bacterium]